jgi:hypothetical protein
MAPDFQLWQDRSRVGDYATPWADVDIRFICLDYQIVEDTDPLVFGPFYDVPPTGGDIPDMPMRTKELVFGNATDDPEGEIFGAIGDGWNVESLVVADGKFETTARVTRGTLAVYDATGVLQHPVDDWQYDGGDGQHFSLTNTSITRVTVVYRAWVVNLRSEYSVPRLPDPSSIRHRPIPEPW